MIYPITRDVFYADRVLAIQVLSRRLAESTTHDLPYAVISITDSPTNLCKLKRSDNLKFVHRVSFRDVRNADLKITKSVISQKDAKDIVEFSKKIVLADIKLLIVHCEMGISRSSAVAQAISEFFNGDGELIRKAYSPNQIVYQAIRQEFNREA